ncbi:MAG TPA: hypothetical protein VIM73_07685, partial [Polyangiaceae bacterium]
MRGRTILVFVAFALCWWSQAYAATIGLVRPSSGSPAITESLFRLQGELMAVGLEVRMIARPPSAGSSSAETKAWLEEFTTERELDAVIDVLGDPTPIAVNVWILHRPSRTFRVSHVTLDTDAREAPEVLAIRTIDVLRANFLVLDLAGKKRSPAPILERPTLGETSRPRLEPVRLLGLEAGAAVVASLDGVGPALLPLLRLNWAVHGAFVAR